MAEPRVHYRLSTTNDAQFSTRRRAKKVKKNEFKRSNCVSKYHIDSRRQIRESVSTDAYTAALSIKIV